MVWTQEIQFFYSRFNLRDGVSPMMLARFEHSSTNRYVVLGPTINVLRFKHAAMWTWLASTWDRDLQFIKTKRGRLGSAEERHKKRTFKTWSRGHPRRKSRFSTRLHAETSRNSCLGRSTRDNCTERVLVLKSKSQTLNFKKLSGYVVSCWQFGFFQTSSKNGHTASWL